MSLAVCVRRSVLLCSMFGLPLIAPLGASADDLPPGWSGKGQAGYVMSRGNSDTDAANAKFDLNYLHGDWKHNLLVDGLYGRSAGIVSAERWDARFQTDYQLTQQLFTFGALSYQRDLFSGFRFQESVTGGAGYKLFDSSTTKLSAQIGVGYRILRPEELFKDDAGAVIARVLQPTESEVVGTAGVDFMHQFNSSTKITDKFVSESGSSNTSIRNDLALEVKMNKKLSLAAGYSVLTNTSPPANTKRTDTITTLNVVYAFPEPAAPK